MTSKQFLLPLTVCGTSSNQNSTQHNGPGIIDSSCSCAAPTVLVSWSTHPKEDEAADNDGPEVAGVTMGCSDGTIYVFDTVAKPEQHRARSSNTSSLRDSSGSRPLRPLSPIRRSRLPQSESRSSSPSSVHSGLAPFSVSSRSRIVSGLSLEQAEAPKNYVDFEDEPEKLKDMLKGKSPKDKPSTVEATASPPSSSRSLLSPGTTLVPPGSDSPAISSLPSTSRSASRAPSPPLSAPESVSTQATSALSLKLHICPPHSGDGQAISCMETVHDNQHVLCLQETG